MSGKLVLNYLLRLWYLALQYSVFEPVLVFSARDLTRKEKKLEQYFITYLVSNKANRALESKHRDARKRRVSTVMWLG